MARVSYRHLCRMVGESMLSRTDDNSLTEEMYESLVANVVYKDLTKTVDQIITDGVEDILPLSVYFIEGSDGYGIAASDENRTLQTITGASGAGIQSLQGVGDITIDNTDPASPVIGRDVGKRDAIEINASGVDGTSIVDSSCNVIVVNVDGVTQTLEFPDPSLIPAEGVQDYSVYVVPTNGGVVRFKMATGFSWVNTGLDSFDVNILSTVTARMHNTTSYTGGLIQVDPLNPTAPTRDGIGDYNDTSTSTTPVTLVADTWTDIPNDGLGTFTNLNFLPSDVTQLIDTSTGYLDLTELNFGDTVFIRNDYRVTPNTNNSLLTFRYVLGTGLGEYTLEKVVGRLDSGSGQPYRLSLTPDMIYVGDANTKDNPVKLQVKLSTNGTLVNAGSAIGVVRR